MKTLSAETAIEHLGGINKLRAMINARNFHATDKALSFRFSGSRKVNSACITLADDDTYNLDVWFMTVRSLSATTHRLSGLYAEDLAKGFETMTHLRLSL